MTELEDRIELNLRRRIGDSRTSFTIPDLAHELAELITNQEHA